MTIFSLPDDPRFGWLPVWQRNFQAWKQHFAVTLAGDFIEPLLYLLVLGHGLGQVIGEIQGHPYLHFIASGILCSSIMFAASMEATYYAYTRMKPRRVWEAMLATPLDMREILRGEMLWAATKGVFSACGFLVVASLLGAVGGWTAIWVLPVALLAGLAFAAMGLVVITFAQKIDFFTFYFTFVITPFTFLSGVFFPLEILPSPVQIAVHGLPLVHVVELVRPLMLGDLPAAPGLNLSVLLAYAVGCSILAHHLANKRMTAG